jgi:putative salt-induced outer membrane protein YdiY
MKLLATILGLALLASPAYAETQLNLNGSLVENSSTTVTSTLQYDSKGDIWQEHFIGDFLYQKVENKEAHTDADIGAKLDYKLDSISYLQAGVRGEFDNLRPNKESITEENGIGYKIIHTDTMKLSDELGIGIHVDKDNNNPIVSNSIWFTWKISPKLTFNNRFLIERGFNKQSVDSYTSNIATLNYNVSPKLELTIQNKYKTEEYVRNNTTLLGITVNF